MAIARVATLSDLSATVERVFSKEYLHFYKQVVLETCKSILKQLEILIRVYRFHYLLCTMSYHNLNSPHIVNTYDFVNQSPGCDVLQSKVLSSNEQLPA